MTVTAPSFEQAEADLWLRFEQHRCNKVRQQLVANYSDFTRMLAATLYAKRHVVEIEFAEFYQYAMIGLLEAIDRFDPGRGVNFRYFAEGRIKGAILDGIHKFNEKQEQITARARLRRERMQDITKVEGDDPFSKLLEVAMGAAVAYMLEGTAQYQDQSSVVEHNAYQSRELADLQRVVRELVALLPQQEALVIRQHYLQELQFSQIAEQLGVTRGRVSQLHRSGLKALLSYYDELAMLRITY